jgi:hypothetical protein
MTAVASPFGSDAGKYKFLGDAKLVNCYAEIRNDNGKAKYNVVPSDGSTLFSAVADTPCRGAFYAEDLDIAYVSHSGRVYQVNSAGTATSVGLLPGIDKVRFARNQATMPQFVIRCDAGLFKIENNVISTISDVDLPDVEDICDADGYIVYIIADGRYFISGLNDAATIDALDFASAEQASDKLVAGWSWGGYLLLFGQRTIEPHKNTGNADFPFEPMPTVIPRGCAGKWTIANCDNSVMFLGDDGIYYRLNGFQPVRISNHEVERLIQSESDPSVIEAQSWSRGGHAFIELKAPTWSKTWDANTGQWHDRETYNQNTWRHNNAFRAWGKTIVGDRLSGNLYYKDSTVYTEASDTQIMKVRFPTLNVFPQGGIVDAVHIDWATGQGVTSPTAQGYSPKLVLRISKDGGNSYSFERELDAGRRGNFKRITARRLGKVGPQGLVMEMAMSDPVGRALAQVDAQVRPLKR